MWILNFVPDFIIHLAVLAGLIALVITTFFGAIIPALYKLPVQIAGIVVLAASLWLEGANYNQSVWLARVAELEEKVKISEEKSTQANTQIEYKFVDKVKVVRDTQVVIQERIREVEKVIDAKCEVPREAIELLNQAAETPGAKK
jgi:hypothetical protein